MRRHGRSTEPVTLHIAAAAVDAMGTHCRPAAVAVADGRIEAVDHPETLDKRLGERITERVEHKDDVLLPSFVNAHAHLDLTSIGPLSYAGSFTDWLQRVIRLGPRDEAAIAAAVRQGAAMSEAAGVGFVGDIARDRASVMARGAARLAGVSYLEFFGLAERQAAAVEVMRQAVAELPHEVATPGHRRGVLLGLSPHAPYSTGEAVYDAATRLSEARACRLSTHLAETAEELAFVRDAAGPLAAMLRDMGKWSDAIQATGMHPIDWMLPQLKRGRWLLAHCNYVEDSHLRLLARTDTSVVYCPIASEYFGHHGHRYRDMLAAGVNVCLGTDSIVCQPADEAQPLGMLAPMRRLFARDGTEPMTLLAMATTRGLVAMEINPQEASLRPGAPAHLNAVRIDASDGMDPLEQVLEAKGGVRVVC